MQRELGPDGVGSAALRDLSSAHNWTFYGAAGQTVVIRVDGRGDCDPRARLIAPSGEVIAEDDDGGGNYNALITAQLPEEGIYTVRADVFTGGIYDISVR